MVNFILYENDNTTLEIVENVINRFLYKSIDHYMIYHFDTKTENVVDMINKINGSKILIVDIDSSYNGLDIVRSVRLLGDYVSPVLLISSKKIETIVKRLNNVLYLDVINKKGDIVRDLFFGLNNAYKIISRNEVYTFSIFDELYRIPYDDIYLIEKNVHDDSVTFYTKDDSYQQYKTIKAVDEHLKKDPRFFKSHRSCIVNLYNIVSYNKESHTIVFKNGMKTNLVARNKRTLLVEKLLQLDGLISV